MRWNECRQCLKINLKKSSLIHFPGWSRRLTSDRLGASCASLCKQFTEAISTVRFLVATSKTLSSKWNLTMSASEALTMPWIILVGDTTACDDLERKEKLILITPGTRWTWNVASDIITHISAFHAASSKLVLITTSAVNILFTRNERFGANWRLADATAETFFMPLASFVFHFFRAWNEIGKK